MTIDASEKGKWSTVTCASCGQLFFGDCSLKARNFPYCLEFAERAKRRLSQAEAAVVKSFSISNRLEIHIHKQAKEPFGSFPFEPIACINAGYAGSSRPTASAHFRRGQLQLCIHSILSSKRIFCIHQISPFHKTRLCSTRSLGRLSPNGETLSVQ